MGPRVSLILLCLALGAAEVEGRGYRSKRGWVLAPGRAKVQLQKGATLLDVRGASAWKKGHLKGALRVSWQQFSRPKAPHRGRLLPGAHLQKQLRALGIRRHRAVVVVGDPRKGWGEEGRIVWMLRSLGHGKAAWVDGGHQALAKAGWPTTRKATAKPQASRYRIRWVRRWSIRRQALRQRYRRVLLLDTRGAREYKGATPYGEARGGHIPGAVHLHFKSLLHKGRLKPRKALWKLFKAKGLRRHREIVAYCTGGVRSAWLVGVLVDMGFAKVRNYAGSAWEWAAGPAGKYPLKKLR